MIEHTEGGVIVHNPRPLPDTYSGWIRFPEPDGWVRVCRGPIGQPGIPWDGYAPPA
jgi:hypothetical protein